MINTVDIYAKIEKFSLYILINFNIDMPQNRKHLKICAIPLNAIISFTHESNLTHSTINCIMHYQCLQILLRINPKSNEIYYDPNVKCILVINSVFDFVNVPVYYI